MPKSKELVLDNLKGYMRRGARTNSPGNIPTGHFELDFIIHYGESPSNVDISLIEDYDPSKNLGLPLGKLVEIFGEEGSGKSSLAYRVCGYAQKMGYECAWIDAENSFAENLAKVNGLDSGKLIYTDLTNEENPDEVYTAEDVFDMIIDMCKTNRNKDGVKVIVLDSVASLVPKVVEENDADKKSVGVLARLMSEQIKKVCNNASKYGVLIIFINQIREKIGVMFGNPETTPGGRALRFQSSVRVSIHKKGGKEPDIYVSDEDGKKKLIGRYARVKLAKNRFAKPYIGSFEIPIYYEEYFPDIKDIAFNLGRQLQLIRVRKGVFSWNDVKVEGRTNFLEHVTYKGLFEDLLKDLVKKSREEGVILPPELAKKTQSLSLDTKEEVSNGSKKTKVRSGGKKKNSSSSKKKSVE